MAAVWRLVKSPPAGSDIGAYLCFEFLTNGLWSAGS